MRANDKTVHLPTTFIGPYNRGIQANRRCFGVLKRSMTYEPNNPESPTVHGREDSAGME